MPERPGKYAWSPKQAAFRDLRTGRFVTSVQVRRTLDTALATAKARAQTLARDLQAGRMDPATFHVQMRTVVKDVHSYSAFLAHGGKAQMDAAAYGRLGARIKAQYQWLDRLATELHAGTAPLDGRLLNRVGMYVEAARGTFFATMRQEMVKRGMDQERNILDRRADHCDGPLGCKSQSARGWVSIGSLIRIGDRACLANCRCTLKFRKAA